MIRSVHIIGSKASGGAERFYARLVRALHETGHPVLAVNPPNSAVARELGMDVPQAHVPMRSIADLPSRWKIRRVASEFGADIVQTYMGRATRLTHLAPEKRPVHVARLGGYYRLKGYRHAHAWIGNTRGIQAYLREGGLRADRVFCIGNFVDTPAAVPPSTLVGLRERLGLPSNALIVGALGRLHPNKGFAHLLEAIAQTPETIADRPVFAVVVGDGPLRRDLETQARRLNVVERVRWPGWVADPGPYYELADLFVCPSVHEPLGNVILEAWAHRRAVLATGTAGPTELIADGEDGVLVPPGDSGSLAQAMIRLLEASEGERARLGEAGLRAVEMEHSRDAVVGAYLDCYRRLLEDV